MKRFMRHPHRERVAVLYERSERFHTLSAEIGGDMWRNSKQSFTPHGHTNRRVATTRRRVNCLLATDRQKAKMRAKTSWLLSATWLLGATAASAQSFPCASVAPEVRDRVREA